MPVAFTELHWARHIEVADYLQPASVQEALDMLQEHQGDAWIIAGGTDVIVQLRQRKKKASVLVDITSIPGLNQIGQEDGNIVIGGAVTHAQAAASELIRSKAGLLAQGCSSVGSPQIRNVATLAGNLVNGQPAADASIPLLALDAEVTIASYKGERKVPLSQFFLDLGKTALDPRRELLTRISFAEPGPNSGGAYQRLAKRKALALPMLVCAVRLQVDPAEKVFSQAAIAVGPVAPTPFRERDIEKRLIGEPVSRETIENAVCDLSDACSPRDSLLRGSCDYRQEMVKVLVRRAIIQALAQAGCPLDRGE